MVPALGDGPGAETLAVSVLVYSAANGFLLGYLWTRIEVSARLKAAADNLAAAQVLSKKPPPPPPSDPVPPALITMAPAAAPSEPPSPVESGSESARRKRTGGRNPTDTIAP